MPARRFLPTLAAIAVALALAPASARAIILLGTGDPAANTTAPTGSLAGSGWQYEGGWGAYLGTPIAPHFFITASHVQQASSAIVFDNVAYTVRRGYQDPASDFVIWEVTDALPIVAPLYTKRDEVGRPLVVFGRGTQRGEAVYYNGATPARLSGWLWGSTDYVTRWGQNTVTDTVLNQPDSDFLRATFDADGSPNEAQVSNGDSGGAVFIQDGAVWKLAGIIYGTEDPFYPDSTGNGGFYAALYDARNFYYSDGTKLVEVTDSAPVPTGIYATRISTRLAWINSVTDPAGSVSDDGVSNLLKYALALDPRSAAGVAGLPKLARSAAGAVTLTYTRPASATDLTYAIEQSADLVVWSAASSVNTVSPATDDGIQTVQATVTASDPAAPLFLRLRVTRP